MAIDCKLDSPTSRSRSEDSPPQGFFPDLLRHAQNPDGGWGYHPGSQSLSEPTAWSILALRTPEATSDTAISSASNWLRRAQLATGAWPVASGKHPGCWVTALVCLALLKISSPSESAVAKGLNWLCKTWPSEGSTWWRFRQRWQRNASNVVRQNTSLRGWGWTPDTASWVEPTAFALLVLQNVAEEYYPPEAKERMQLGEKMLYDRVCPGGGWNAGNPLVYGVPGLPRVGPTVWSLLALRNHQDRAANVESIEWLERSHKSIKGPGSLALAQLCLKVYGREMPPIEPGLHAFYSNNQFLQNIPVLAWASLAVGALPDWLGCAARTEGEA